CIIEPGAHRTEFGPKAGWGERSLDPSSPYYRQTLGYRSLREQLGKGRKGFSGSPGGVVRAVVGAAEASRLPLRLRRGLDARLVSLLKRVLPERTLRSVLQWAYRRMYRSPSTRPIQSGAE